MIYILIVSVICLFCSCSNDDIAGGTGVETESYITGYVLDIHDNPVTFADVHAIPQDVENPLIKRVTSKTDNTGKYTLLVSSNAFYTLSISKVVNDSLTYTQVNSVIVTKDTIITPKINQSKKQYIDNQNYIRGVALPFNMYGYENMKGHWGEPDKFSHTWFLNAMQTLSNAGITHAQCFLDYAGNTTLLKDTATGYVLGHRDSVIAHLTYVLRTAETHQVKTNLVLWDGRMAYADLNKGGDWGNLFLDDDAMDSYINSTLLPLLDTLKNYPSLFTIEILSAPEWVYDADASITQQHVRRFAGRIAAQIHAQLPSVQVTLSNVVNEMLFTNGSFAWNDSLMQAASGEAAGHLDYYSFIFTPIWNNDTLFHPLIHPADIYNLDKPLIITHFDVGRNSKSQDSFLKFTTQDVAAKNQFEDMHYSGVYLYDMLDSFDTLKRALGL